MKERQARKLINKTKQLFEDWLAPENPKVKINRIAIFLNRAGSPIAYRLFDRKYNLILISHFVDLQKGFYPEFESSLGYRSSHNENIWQREKYLNLLIFDILEDGRVSYIVRRYKPIEKRLIQGKKSIVCP